MTTLTILSALLVWLTGLRAYRRLRQEAQRQRVLTWPRATAVLDGEEDELEVYRRDEQDLPLFYRARLTRPYTFYARGERWTGTRLAPELERLNGEEGQKFLRELGKHRRYEICYNPEDPADNYLTAGPGILGNWVLALFALAGVFIPLLILRDMLPDSIDMILLAAAFFLFVVYYLVQPILDLRKHLQPTADMTTNDDLLESLNREAERRKTKVKHKNLA